jgi:hypothetical protein
VVDSCDHGNESLIFIPGREFLGSFIDYYPSRRPKFHVKLATLDEEIYVSREREVMFVSSLKVQQHLWCSPTLLISRYRAFLPGGKNGRNVNLISHIQVTPCLKLRNCVRLIPHTSSHVFMDL